MKIVIAGNYGAGNIGDEMILKGLLQSLRSIVPFAEITVLSGKPEETEKLYDVKSAEKFPAGVRSMLNTILNSKSRTAKLVKECDYFILGGGGLFGGVKKRANIIWGIQALMAYHYKKPVIMYGQSVGALRGTFERWLVNKVFKKAKLIVVRDEKSRERLKALKIRKEIHVLPDLAFNIKIEEKATNRQKKLLVALRQMENISELFKKSIAEFLNWLISEHKWQVTFVSFQKGEDADHPLHEEILEMIIDKPYVDLIDDQNIERILGEFLEAEMVLGMRLHSLISAIKTKTPFIAINYAPKVADFLGYMKLDPYMINVDEINTARLKEQFDKIQADKENISKNLQKNNDAAQSGSQKMESLLREVLS